MPGQVLGAGQGDFQRLIVAPTTQLDLFQTIPELFNLTDKYQCPGLVLSDLLLSEGTGSVDPAALDFKVKIDRGEMIFPKDVPQGNGKPLNPGSGYNDDAYWRYKNTASGISPRAVPGTPGHIHVAATDEHDEDGTLISDEFTNPTKRRTMVEKRAGESEKKGSGYVDIIAHADHDSIEDKISMKWKKEMRDHLQAHGLQDPDPAPRQ